MVINKISKKQRLKHRKQNKIQHQGKQNTTSGASKTQKRESTSPYAMSDKKEDYERN